MPRLFLDFTHFFLLPFQVFPVIYVTGDSNVLSLIYLRKLIKEKKKTFFEKPIFCEICSSDLTGNVIKDLHNEGSC